MQETRARCRDRVTTKSRIIRAMRIKVSVEAVKSLLRPSRRLSVSSISSPEPCTSLSREFQ